MNERRSDERYHSFPIILPVDLVRRTGLTPGQVKLTAAKLINDIHYSYFLGGPGFQTPDQDRRTDKDRRSTHEMAGNSLLDSVAATATPSRIYEEREPMPDSGEWTFTLINELMSEYLNMKYSDELIAHASEVTTDVLEAYIQYKEMGYERYERSD